MEDVVKAHARRAHRKVRGQVDLSDLMQIGMIMAWKAARTYTGKGTLEGWMHEILWRGYRDVVRNVIRRRKVVSEYPLEEAEKWAKHNGRPDDEAMLNALVREYENRLTPRAFLVLQEMVHPSTPTMQQALASNLRKKHLRKQGLRVEEVFQVTVFHVARGLNLPLSVVERAVTEIRREVRKDFPGGAK